MTVDEPSQCTAAAAKPQPEFQPAHLETIDLALLRDGCPKEAEKLFGACVKFGFFYLDIRSLGEGTFTNTVDGIFKLDEELFALDHDEKAKYDIDQFGLLKLNGYKPVGRNYAGLRGKKDGFESWALPKNGLLGLADWEHFSRPQIFEDRMATIMEFLGGIATITGAIFASLSRTLQLPPGGTFEDHHRFAAPSPDIIRLLMYHAQPADERGAPQTPHTDLGSLTVLFARQPGLQVLPHGATDWAYVLPKPGHAVINLGDGMAALTNGLFHACLHQVAPLPQQPMDVRYSFAYLVRAQDDTPMTGLDSPLIPKAEEGKEVFTSGEWTSRKFQGLRLNKRTEKEVEDFVVTGTRTGLPSV